MSLLPCWTPALQQPPPQGLGAVSSSRPPVEISTPQPLAEYTGEMAVVGEGAWHGESADRGPEGPCASLALWSWPGVPSSNEKERMARAEGPEALPCSGTGVKSPLFPERMNTSDLSTQGSLSQPFTCLINNNSVEDGMKLQRSARDRGDCWDSPGGWGPWPSGHPCGLAVNFASGQGTMLQGTYGTYRKPSSPVLFPPLQSLQRPSSAPPAPTVAGQILQESGWEVETRLPRGAGGVAVGRGGGEGLQQRANWDARAGRHCARARGAHMHTHAHTHAHTRMHTRPAQLQCRAFAKRLAAAPTPVRTGLRQGPRGGRARVPAPGTGSDVHSRAPRSCERLSPPISHPALSPRGALCPPLPSRGGGVLGEENFCLHLI